MALIPFLQNNIHLPYGWAWFLSQTVFVTVICLVLMLGVAAVILADRKIWAAVQMRRGPNVVGPFGLLQTIADAFKFLLKEVIVPAGANKVIFFLAPLVTATLAFAGWAVVPLDNGWVAADINVGILYLFAMSSLGVYGIIMAGWASNSKYPFLSALRAAAQMVSYEVSIGFVIITVLLFAGSLNVSEIVRAQEIKNTGVMNWFAFLNWNVFSILFPMLIIFFVSSLAETQRPPFDLLEAESELVAGFFVEYSSGPFLLFFLAEYMNVIMLCGMMSILFLAKTAFLFFMMAMVKAMVPRYRYDQLMRLGWKVFLPTSLVWVVLTAAWVLVFRHHA